MTEPIPGSARRLLGLDGDLRPAKPAPVPFVPRMELGWDDCDPVATCHCGARCKGDSINDALIAWGKHVTTVHRDEQTPGPKTFPHGWPHVKGRCPACRMSALFLGDGGYVTCGNLNCSNPCAATEVLEQP